MEYVISLVWDKEAGVWIATSDDLQGLVLESNSIEGLIEKIKLATPELLSLNRVPIQKEIYLCFYIRCQL